MQIIHSCCRIADKSSCLRRTTTMLLCNPFDARCSLKSSSETNPAACVLSLTLSLCSSIQKGAEDCKDLLDAFQACIKTLSEGS